ncbi:MAG: DUF4912 domain-containing protein [Sphaerochaeta sp.]
MILVNMDSLSIAELRYLAEREGIEGFDTMDQEDLLDELSDILEISDGAFNVNKDLASSSNRRYVNALSDFPGHETAEGLPGVEELTDIYKETSIHLMMRDLNWAFAYWSISPLTQSKLIEEDASYLKNVFLRVTSTNDKTCKTSVYDIEVSKDDTSWNINLPDFGHTYQVALCVQNDSGMLIALAQSLAITVPQPYWTTNTAELEEDPVLFNALFSSIISRDGQYKDDIVIPELVNKLVAREGKR